MPKINFAHFYEHGTNGQRIQCAVFEANSRNNTNSGRADVLAQLTAATRRAGKRIDQSVLMYEQNGEIRFYGNKNLVDYLANSGIIPEMTNSIEIR